MAESTTHSQQEGMGRWEDQEEEDELNETKIAYQQWLEEFHQESDSQTDEEEDEYCGLEIHSQNPQSTLSDTFSHKVTSQKPLAGDDKDITSLPVFDLDLNWDYGGHISSVDPYHRNQILTKKYCCNTYSQSLLPSLPVEDYLLEEIICSQYEISHMILLMLNGTTSDIFHLTSDGINSFFSLTPLGKRLRIKDITSSTLVNFLDWFLQFGNDVQAVRSRIYNPSSPLNYVEHYSPHDEPYSAFLLQILGPIKSTLRDIFSTFQSLLLQLESRIPDPSLDENEMFASPLTILQLFLKVKSWREIFKSCMLGITTTLTKISLGTTNSTDLLKYFPLLKAEDLKSYENQDFVHHIHLNSMITQLLNGLSNAHLLSSHLSTISSDSTLNALGREFVDCDSSPLRIRSNLSFQHVCLPCFTALQGAYLKSFFTWIFQTDKPPTSSKSHDNYYATVMHFGGLSYDHSISALTFQNRQALTPTNQLIAKFNTFSPLWRPFLLYGAMTKINIQVLIKHDSDRSKRSALLRDFVSAAEKVNMALQTLLQRSGIHSIFPSTNIFSEMINDERRRSCPLDFSHRSEVTDHLKLFLSSPLSASQYASSHESKSSLVSLMEISQSMISLSDIFPSLIHLLNNFCIEPLYDNLFISQQHAIRAFIRQSPSHQTSHLPRLSPHQSQSYDLIYHLEFHKKIFFLGDPLLYDPIFDYLRNPSSILDYPAHSSKKPYKHIAEDLFSNIEQNIYRILPEEMTTHHIGLIDKSTTQSTKSTLSYEKTTVLRQILDSLTVEIHHTPPLSDFFTPENHNIYNSSLQFLLKLQCCMWSCELLWKQLISSSSSAILQEGYTMGSSTSQETIVTPTTYVAYHEIIRHAIHGMQVLLHYLKSLKSFYMNEIHVIYWSDLISSLTSSSSSVNSFQSIRGQIFLRTRTPTHRPSSCTPTSIEDLFISHNHYLIKIQTLLSFLRPNNEEIITKGFKSMINFEELNALLATEKQVSQYSDPLIKNQSKQLLESKIQLVFKEFNGMMTEINQWKQLVLEICTSPSATASILPLSTSTSDHIPSLQTEVLYYHYANSLRMIMGL